MRRVPSFLALFVASALGACRGVWDLGDAPSRITAGGASGAGGAASSGSGGGGASSAFEASSATSASAGGSAATSGASTGQGGGGGSARAGTCGACVADEECGAVGEEGRCDEDGLCRQAVWPLSATAKGFGDSFVVGEDFVALVIDEGLRDRADAPRDDNALVFVDRKTGELAAYPFAATSIGALAASPEGLIAYAPRAIDEGDASARLFIVERDGSRVPWPGEQPTTPLRGLRWDSDEVRGGAFRAIQSTDVGDRIIRFSPGSFDPCAESGGVLPWGRLWATSSPSTRVLIADDETSAHPMSVLELAPNACDEAALSTTLLDGSFPARPIALVGGEGFVATILAAEGTTTNPELVVATLDGDVLLSEPTPGGRALAVGADGVYAVRGGRLSVFSGTTPTSSTPVDTFGPAESIVDLVVSGEAIFAATIDSNEEARLVCARLR